MFEEHPAEGQTPNFKGSMIIAVANSAAEVKEIISNDIYAKEGVWDVENAQIIPVRWLFLFPVFYLFFVFVLFLGDEETDGNSSSNLLCGCLLHRI